MPPNNNQQPLQNPPQQPLPNLPQDQQTATPPIPQQPIIQAGMPGSTPVESSKKKIIGIILGVVLIIGIPIILFLIFVVFGVLNSGKTQSTKISMGFMGAITAGDTATALTYTDGSGETKKFIENIAPSVKATSFTNKASTSKADKFYYLYTLEGATNNSARTELEKNKDNGKWQISGFYSGNNLALVASDSADENTEAQAPSNSTQCLVQSDFDNWYKGLYGKTATESDFKFHNPPNMYTANVHFPADSLDYSADMTGGVENVIKLANDPLVKSKQFTIHLYGSVGTSQADQDFANKRAEVVKKDLLAGGVPASKIVIDTPQSATDYDNNPDAVDKGMSRVVVLKFDPTCSSSSSGR